MALIHRTNTFDNDLCMKYAFRLNLDIRLLVKIFLHSDRPPAGYLEVTCSA